MTDPEIENEIKRKGLTAPRITEESIEEQIIEEQYHVFPGTTLTVCVLTMRNGYQVVGEAACASPANFDEELGRKIARKSAARRIWALEGYRLRSALAEAA